MTTPALDLIRDPAAWSKTTTATYANKHPCALDDPDACRFCLFGAIYRAYPETGQRKEAFAKVAALIRPRLGREVQAWGDTSVIMTYNDMFGTKHADVLSVLERAQV